MFLVIGPLASLGGSWLTSFIHSLTHLASQNTQTTRKRLRVNENYTQVIRITSQFLAFLIALWNHNPQIFQQVETSRKTNNLFLKLEKKTKDEYLEVIQGNLYHTIMNQLLKQANNNWQCKEFNARSKKRN